MLHPQLAWYVAGPLMGLCVVACRALFNGRLGITGGYSELVGRLRERRIGFDWRGWFLIGVLLGGGLFALASGGPDFHGYGWLTASLHGSERLLIAPILLLSGVLIGFGAKLAGGCTSGNGLSATAMRSPAGIAATATFFATAIAISFITRWLV
ncbi:MAG: YeeE/YedE family protein [Solirubrobacterales bacterium]|nr:YeeE/YedE family protein [Solirubrobacterales bacterium]MBV9472336.1 YeeE/YedE family protein [Solirubrobacterales bacterium]MBV9837938.1 YeeE/YedE family protein [Solirubrobacterales bacterium]